MTGLEAILNQINGDAQSEANELLSEAKAKADSILEAARKEAADKTQERLAAGEEKAQSIRDRANSAAALERRNAMLAFKQQEIREAIDFTRASLEALPDKEYFSLLVQLCTRFAGEGKAEMRLNRKDLERLPAGYEAILKEAVPQGDITVSSTPCEIDSGFLLIYGGIDINCTFRAIFEDMEGELRDAVGAILFPGA